MKKTISLILVFLMISMNKITTEAGSYIGSDEISDLYGLSVLLMDANTGEVLFEKNGAEPMAIASTTKILTCMLALEHGNPDDVVTISSHASAKPDVQMNVVEGEQYYLQDLLKGMMLESYNDISVAVAEHIAGNESAFADMMNAKAKKLGCENSYFITPNGLDDEKDGKVNQSTAKDLALILRYAIQNDDFLEITQTAQHMIQELNGKRMVTAVNRNRFLNEYEGALSGKTGFTNKAGYCYAGAAKRDDRTFVAVTLAAGWPPNKNYKWSDIRRLFDYGFEHYVLKEPDLEGVIIPERLPVDDGIDENGKAVGYIHIEIPQMEELLLHEKEHYYVKVYMKENLQAPVKKGMKVGKIEFYRNDLLIGEKDLLSIDDVEKASFWKKLYYILAGFFSKISGNLLKFIRLQGIIN